MPEPGLLLGRSEIRAAWLALLAQPQPKWRRITLVDADLADWPLDDAGVLQGLTAWLRQPGRQLHLLALDYNALARAHPRFARWRRDWVHRLSCGQPIVPASAATWPSLALADTVAIELLDRVHWRARVLTDVLASQHQVDALAQRCEAAWPMATLGL